MWYLIADANGLTASDSLPAGEILIIPNKVTNIHNRAGVYRVYDPGEAIGDAMPILPPQAVPPTHHHTGGCGVIGQVLLVAVAAAVTYFTAGAASAALGPVLGGAASGAAGAVASQAVGVATGIQDHFSFKGIALAAISGGIAGGVSEYAQVAGLGGDGFGATFARGAISSSLTQGVAITTGLQSNFDWAGVATAGITSAVAAKIPSVGTTGLSRDISAGLSGSAAAVAGAAVRTFLTGTDFGDNVLAALPDVVGDTIGNALAQDIEGGRRFISGISDFSTYSTPSQMDGYGDLSAVDAMGEEFDSVGNFADHTPSNVDTQSSLAAVNAYIVAENEKADPFLKFAHDAIRQTYGMTLSQASQAASSPDNASNIYVSNDGNGGAYDGPPAYTANEYWNQGMTSFGIPRMQADGSYSWVENADTMARVNSDLAQFDRQVGIGLAAPILIGGGAAVGWAALPSLAEFAGYEGTTATMLQTAGLKAGIGVTIEVGGNLATHSETTVGGVLGSAVASAFIAPSATNAYGVGFKGLTMAGGASGFGGNLLGQSIDYSSGHSFSGSDLILSTLFGAAGGALGSPAQKFGPTSLLFHKATPFVEELYNFPSTATGAITDVVRKTITPAVKHVVGDW